MSNSIDALENYHINQKDIQKLKDIGINTIQGLYMTSRKTLLTIKGFTEKKIKSIFNEANKIEVYGLFQKATTFMKDRNENIFKLSTNSKNLDYILKGGIESGSITELLGEKDSGKTDFVHILSAASQKNNSKSKIIFIDLDNTFNQKKITNFSKALNLNKKKVLDNITLLNGVEFFEEFMTKLDEISEKMKTGEYCLIIIKSFISIFQKLFEGKSMISPLENIPNIKMDIESKLGQALLKLKNIAFLFNTVVLITRRINDNKDDSNDLCVLDPNIDIILGNECVTRFKFKKIKHGKIKCIILNSPILPEGDCKFIINEKGIIDC